MLLWFSWIEWDTNSNIAPKMCIDKSYTQMLVSLFHSWWKFLILFEWLINFFPSSHLLSAVKFNSAQISSCITLCQTWLGEVNIPSYWSLCRKQAYHCTFYSSTKLGERTNINGAKKNINNWVIPSCRKSIRNNSKLQKINKKLLFNNSN